MVKLNFIACKLYARIYLEFGFVREKLIDNPEPGAGN